jgi:hypothetical protein
VIGLQLLLWTLSGLIFSWNSIKSVRGDDWVRQQEPHDLTKFNIKSFGEILKAAESRTTAGHSVVSGTLTTMLDRPVYELTLQKDGVQSYVLVDAEAGQVISPIDEGTAKQIAQNDFAVAVDVRSVELVESVGSHSEYRGKELPAYRIVMDHPTDTAIYVSADRGVVTTRRNNQWRWFDFFWMLHTMDYQGRDNFNQWILKTVSIFGLVTILSGFVLWFKTSRLFRRRRKIIAVSQTS